MKAQTTEEIIADVMVEAINEALRPITKRLAALEAEKAQNEKRIAALEARDKR